MVREFNAKGGTPWLPRTRRLAAWCRRTGLAVALAACGLASAAPAWAVACKDLPNPVYGTGGSAHKPFLGKYAKTLANFPDPITIVYQAPGACVAMAALTDKDKGAGLLTGTASYWKKADGKEDTCDLPVAGQPVDFGAMGVSPSSCAGFTKAPAGVGEWQGVINSWNVLVPVASTEQSISAEALFFIFGFGKAGKVEPWIDETQYFVRNATSAATIALALATGLPVNKFIGVDTKTNQGTVTGLAQSTSPQAAIGYVSGEVADANRATVKTLAYQHFDQTCGYWPDSTPTAFDKRGVREGQYYLWSPTHLFAYVDAGGVPVNPLVGKLVGWFAGTLPAPDGVNVLDLTIANGNVPECAMHVWRDGDLAPLYSYQPKEPCNGYFEFKATGTTTAKVCKASTDCGTDAPVCRHGYCEVN